METPAASPVLTGFTYATAAGMVKLRFAMVCASNQNRSMEAHALLQKNGLNVGSYGVAAHVKLPGPSLREANVYAFGTPYEQMHTELSRKDPELYKRNGVLQMLQRNMQVKVAPERFQDTREPFDVVLTFEERVMDQVVEDLAGRPQELMRPVLVANMDRQPQANAATECKVARFGGGQELEMGHKQQLSKQDVKDSHQEAALAAPCAQTLCEMLEAAEEWEDEVDAIVEKFQEQTGRRVIYTICFY